MAIDQSEFGMAPVDRSTVLLAELQAVCQRILADEGRQPGEPGHVVPTLISTASGSAVASSLEALRRQCADNNQQVVGLKRSVDGLRAVASRDSADNAKMLTELSRIIDTMTQTVAREQADKHDQITDLVRSVEALRVGLAGFSANNRQKVSDLQGSLQSVEQAVAALPGQVETALMIKVDASLAGLGGRVGTALGTMGEQVAAGAGSVGSLGHQVEGALASLGSQITVAFGTMASQIQDAFNAFGAQISGEMASQTGNVDSLLKTREQLDELGALLSVGLPKFSEEIQAGVQQTLLDVSRTFRLAEREHGNRMAELHRDFDTTARRLEAAIQPRRRDERQEREAPNE